MRVASLHRASKPSAYALLKIRASLTKAPFGDQSLFKFAVECSFSASLVMRGKLRKEEPVKKTESSQEVFGSPANAPREQNGLEPTPRITSSSNPDTQVEAFIEEVLRLPKNAKGIEWIQHEPARDAQFLTDSEDDSNFHGLDSRWKSYLQEQGIHRLYSHQGEAVDGIREGKHVVVVSATASGKSLCYNLPVLDHFLKKGKGYALYLFPTKALAQDQMRTLDGHIKGLGLSLEAGVFDGDTEPHMRKRLKQKGRLILTNPDMLHRSILPHHGGWAGLFAGLKYIVVDEVHSVRGIFGSNVANVIRRLKRIAKRYGASPQFIVASATISNPQEHAESLLGEKMQVIDKDGSPRGARTVVFWNPPLVERPDGTKYRKGPLSVATRILPELLERGIRTIGFCQARSSVELMLRYVWDRLKGNKSTKHLAEKLESYRAGYLPNERREIERRLFSGELLGVVSTNALELGIDIGGLDACLLVGYPGTVASFLQRAGRAGRRARHSLVIFVAGSEPIDQYFMRHPDAFFQKSPEAAVIEPENPYILTKHLICAAYELPLTLEDAQWFTGGDQSLLRGILDLLAQGGQLKKANGKYHYVEKDFPAKKVKLRTVGDENFTIYEGKGEKIIGELDYVAGLLSLYEGAIYIHRSETHFVEELDVENQIARLRKDDSGYYTQALLQKTVEEDQALEKKAWPNLDALKLSEVTVETRITGFKKVRFHTVENIGYGEVDLPPIRLETVALHFEVPQVLVEQAMEFGSEFFFSGLHGVCRLFTGLMPFFVMGDPRDIDYFIDGNTVYIYDVFEGGIGYSEKAYEKFEGILKASLEHANSCNCPAGCPSCVLPSSSRYEVALEPGIREFPKPKEAAKYLLHAFLGLETYKPNLEGVDLAPKPNPLEPEEALDPQVARKVERAMRGLKKFGLKSQED